MTTVCVVTPIPSPYQAEFFNALNRCGLNIAVAYLQRFDSSRLWGLPTIAHEHCFLDEDASAADEWIHRKEFVVFSCYQQRATRRLIELRHELKRPWAFWGERPGARLSGWFGRRMRAWVQHRLLRSRAPIWGVGNWGVEGYRREFGDERCYINLPYFSNLDHFLAVKKEFGVRRPCRFLFSGTFNFRKGIDLLAVAFRRVLQNGIDAELHLLGAGPLEKAIVTDLSSVSSKVHLHGFKQPSELASFYAYGDVLVAPSRYDGWGMMVPEGLASAMPVISTNRTGAALELIAPSHGWIIPAGDEDALSRAMSSAAAMDIEKRREMSQCARQAAMRQNLNIGVERFARAVELSLQAWKKS